MPRPPRRRRASQCPARPRQDESAGRRRAARPEGRSRRPAGRWRPRRRRRRHAVRQGPQSRIRGRPRLRSKCRRRRPSGFDRARPYDQVAIPNGNQQRGTALVVTPGLSAGDCCCLERGSCARPKSRGVVFDETARPVHDVLASEARTDAIGPLCPRLFDNCANWSRLRRTQAIHRRTSRPEPSYAVGVTA